LPEPWDGSIRAALAVELEINRDVSGIPTSWEPNGAGRAGPPSGAPTETGEPGQAGDVAAPAQREDTVPGTVAADGPGGDQAGSAEPRDPLISLGAARLACEVLRSLARVGEEMVVTIEPDGSIAMAVAIEGTGPGPDLSHLAEAARFLGGELSVRAISGGMAARLRLPRTGPPR
jgi:hypothetical protein